MSEQFKIKNVSKNFGRIHLVAFSLLNNQPVGEAVAISVGKTANIFTFYINRDKRNQGAGSLLLSELEQVTLQEGNTSIKRIGWFCDEESIQGFFRARKFFKKHGYSDKILYLSKKLAK